MLSADRRTFSIDALGFLLQYQMQVDTRKSVVTFLVKKCFTYVIL